MERYGVFIPNVGKYGPEKTPYLDTLHARTINYFHFFIVFVVVPFAF